MNKINFNCVIDSPEGFIDVFEKLMSMSIVSGAFHVEFILIMDSITINDVKRIIDYIASHSSLKDATNDCINTFILIMKAHKKSVQAVSKNKGFLTRIEIIYDENDMADIEYVYKRLAKKNISCVLLIKDTTKQKIIPIYDKVAKIGIPIFSSGEVEYKNVTLEDFISWAYDVNGVRLSLFSDLANRIILDYWGTCCKYKSCLTKYFTVDVNGDIYSCRTKRNLVCNISEVSQLQEIIENDAFMEIVKNAISVRDDCKAKCEHYKICQGGCPLQSFDGVQSCNEKTVFSLYVSVEKKLTQIIQDEDYRNLNPALRDIILSGAASNKLFKAGLYH